MNKEFILVANAYIIISLIYFYKMAKTWGTEKGDISHPLFSFAYIVVALSYFYMVYPKNFK